MSCSTCGQKLPSRAKTVRIQDISQLAFDVELESTVETQLRKDKNPGTRGVISKDYNEGSVSRIKLEELDTVEYSAYVDWNDGVWYPKIIKSRNVAVAGDPFSREYQIALEKNGGSIYVQD